MLKNTAFGYTFWYDVLITFQIRLILSPESHMVLPLLSAVTMLVFKGVGIPCCPGECCAFWVSLGHPGMPASKVVLQW